MYSLRAPFFLAQSFAAHSADADWRPLSSYEYQELRILHILGFYDE